MNIRPHDTLSNLKNWPAYDYKDYRLNKDEADNCIAALENYIWHNVKKEGMPKEDGCYLFKFFNPDDSDPHYIFDTSNVKNGILRMSDALECYAISWRKIVDYDMEE